jgi:IS5 family transposase
VFHLFYDHFSLPLHLDNGGSLLLLILHTYYKNTPSLSFTKISYNLYHNQILLPTPPNKTQSYYQKRKLSRLHRKRAGIEAVIGHLKTDLRLKRNFYKGILGDNINIMLAAAAFNFKRLMNLYKVSFCLFLQRLFYSLQRLLSVKNKFKYTF